MTVIKFLTDRFQENKDAEAIIWKNNIFTYDWLLNRVNFWCNKLNKENITNGKVVVVNADFSPESIAIFLALTEQKVLIVPIAHPVESVKSKVISVSQAEIIITIDKKDHFEIKKLENTSDSGLYDKLREKKQPGLVLFSSGSSGEPKGAVHDLAAIYEKFKINRHQRRSILFLLFDHIGGINTMLYTLSNAGCLVTIQDRNPHYVLSEISRHSVDMLPTSPTFLNLMLLSNAYESHDLSCLKLVTYGTEPMTEEALKKFHRTFPQTRLQQTYGLTEVGILRSKSKSSDSLWVKVGGEGFETRIVNGILHVKAKSAMLGYLNAPSPFTEDGWLNTGDRVERDGDYIKILGRDSEMINVGGQKVNPVEVEGVVQEMENILEVTVYGEKNFIMGTIVCARVTLKKKMDSKTFTRQLKKFCRSKLENFKIPVKVILTNERQHTRRFKKDRAKCDGA